MKKSLLAIGLSLTMVLAMATPAFAANPNPNVNADGTAVTKPGHPVYDTVNTQKEKESFNEATISSTDGKIFTTVNDDDAYKAAVDPAADINVWAKVTDSASKVYKVDLAWGAMKFEYSNTAGSWDPATHTYSATGTAAVWTTSFIDGKNNNVKVTNHSNNAIDATFVYAMEGTAFNAVATGNDAVVGNFFDNNTKALAAALKLTGTYSSGTRVPATDSLLMSKISLPTADGYNSTAGTGDAANTTDNHPMDPLGRSGNVCFAFSGTPDAGKGKDLDTFKKVGVIVVAVTPNNDVPLNRPLFVSGP